MKLVITCRRLWGALLVAAVALTACSSVKTKVDNGPVRARSFSFVNPGFTTATAPAANVAAVHTMLQNAIARTLAAKGLSQLPSGGDVTVAYLVIAGNSGVTTAFDDYFGSGSDATDLLEKVHQADAVGSARTDYLAAGTLVIDVRDSKTGKLLWRNSQQRDILQNPTPEVRAERIQEVVDAALRNLRISS